MSYSIVGEQILRFRKERGLTQRELGERAGVSSSAVSQWESGGTPDISLLPTLSDILGVTVDALFGRTGIERENMEEVLGGYIASLPEKKRLGETVSLIRKAVMRGYMNNVADIVDVECHNAEETYISHDGLIMSVSSGGRSFLSAIHNAEGGFDALLSCDESVCRLFSTLADPSALTMLVNLYREAPKYRTLGALAPLAGIPPEQAEAVLSRFTELHLTEELSLETEEGPVKAYKVSLNGATVPLLVSAWLMTEPTTSIKLISDHREPAISQERE